MHLHEYQAKEILKRYGIPIPPFGVAESVDQAEQIIKDLGLDQAVLKIQVHAGGRGKAGGVKFAKSKDEIIKRFQELIGMRVVNHQTGPYGMVARSILMAKPIDIAKEFYLGAVIDRKNGKPLLIASPYGGMEIEEVAAKNPDKILKLPIQLNGTIRHYHLVRLANFMGWKGEKGARGVAIAKGVALAFIQMDGELLEINPLVETLQGEMWAVDAKFSLDDNALFRQKGMATLFDETQSSKGEVEARKHGLAYISLEGEIGCMVNGAGLAMATMDLIHHYGGRAANFLDVGGGASREKVTEGCKIILADPKVQTILVNIFGGIMNCQTIAEGLIYAAKELGIKVPLVVRLEGTNVEKGREILKKSHLTIRTAEEMADAAKKAVELVKKAG